MAEKGGNGSPLPRGKAAAPLKQGRIFSFSYFPWSYFEARLKQSDLILRMLASESGFVEEKVPTSLNANEKSSAEQKSGKKKVSFGSLKSSGKASFDVPTAKGENKFFDMFNFTGDLGKGGKGFNVGKAGGKGSIPEATPIKPLVTEVELKLELVSVEGGRKKKREKKKEKKILGVLFACGRFLRRWAVLSPRVGRRNEATSFSKALQYAKINARYTNVQSVRQLNYNVLCPSSSPPFLTQCHALYKFFFSILIQICMIGNVDPETLDEVYALIPSLKVRSVFLM
ncbi:hypothetical protein B296_00047319 [Ensete ventricosum]|uniref:Uncharacterized protein n=1 Tax=Ensete ventricosum TaxID=4639 RepID=A0A426XMD3_ENSVE|nr:hypothetical protein B296_00047319 [Ensete ventricosum]